jgi:hypothetical protein
MSDNRDSLGSHIGREREEVHLLHEILNELKLILKELKKDASHVVASFKIFASLIGKDSMNINPGQSTVLTAVPLDASGNGVALPSGDVPSWSASDTSQIVATPSADGLSLTVAINSPATAGDVIFTIADALIPTATGTFTLSIVPGVTPPPGGVASFSITASTPARKR